MIRMYICPFIPFYLALERVGFLIFFLVIIAWANVIFQASKSHLKLLEIIFLWTYHYLSCIHCTVFYHSIRNPPIWRRDIGQIISIQIKKRKKLMQRILLLRWYALCSCATLISRVMLISWLWKFWRKLFSKSKIFKDNTSCLPLYRQCSLTPGDSLCQLWTFSFLQKVAFRHE